MNGKRILYDPAEKRAAAADLLDNAAFVQGSGTWNVGDERHPFCWLYPEDLPYLQTAFDFNKRYTTEQQIFLQMDYRFLAAGPETVTSATQARGAVRLTITWTYEHAGERADATLAVVFVLPENLALLEDLIACEHLLICAERPHYLEGRYGDVLEKMKGRTSLLCDLSPFSDTTDSEVLRTVLAEYARLGILPLRTRSRPT